MNVLAIYHSIWESMLFQYALGALCQRVIVSSFLFVCKECDISLQKEQLKLLWRCLLCGQRSRSE